MTINWLEGKKSINNCVKLQRKVKNKRLILRAATL